MSEPDLPYFGKTSHPDCSPKTGHVCQEPTNQKCWTAGCDREAGTLWGPYWCPDHDARRLDRISEGMRAILEEFNDISQCIGITAKGDRCRRTHKGRPEGGYICPTHAFQDGVEDGNR